MYIHVPSFPFNESSARSPSQVLEDGTKVPHEGVESIFCTGTTLDIVGLKDLGQGEPMLLLKAVAKDVILHDINFRAAISDFSVIKHKMNECGTCCGRRRLMQRGRMCWMPIAFCVC